MTTSPTTADRELAILDSLVTGIVETRAAIASLQAFEAMLLASADALADEQVSRLAATSSREREVPRRAIAAEIGAATRTSDRTVQRRMGEAAVLTRQFPAAVQAWGAGRIDRGHVTVIVETGGTLTDAAARADFETAALALAQRETRADCARCCAHSPRGSIPNPSTLATPTRTCGAGCGSKTSMTAWRS